MSLQIMPKQIPSNSSLDTASTHASSVNMGFNKSKVSADGATITPSPAFTPSSTVFTRGLTSTQSLLSLDPLSTFMEDMAADSFHPNPVYVSSYSSEFRSQQSIEQKGQISQPLQSPQQQSSTPLEFDNIQMSFPLMTPDVFEQQSQFTIQNQEISSYNPNTTQPVPTPTPPSAPPPSAPTSQNAMTDEAVAQIVSNTSVPEFLYQLTKMLTDEHREIIEWSNAKIEVHNPHRLEIEVLNKYFRHSKYASFQRQLNYFGFRKLAGKGKMAPCSYVNENATTDLRSLLRMKRKTSATTKENTDALKNKKSSTATVADTLTTSGVKRNRNPNEDYVSIGPVAKIAVGKGVRHQLNGYLRNPNSKDDNITPVSAVPSSTDPSALAKSAVGKGVAHHFTMLPTKVPSCAASSRSTSLTFSLDASKLQHPACFGNNFTFLDPSQLGMEVQSDLSALQTNFQNSLTAALPSGSKSNGNVDNTSSNTSGPQLKRESSLVALAMIPNLESFEPTSVFSEDEDGIGIGMSLKEIDDKFSGPSASVDDDNGSTSFMDFPE